MPEDRQERTKILGWAILTRTKLLNNLARYDGHLGRRFFRGVELMIDIRREDRQLREAYEAKNAGAATPVHYLPDDDPPAMQNTAQPHRPDIGFRPAEKSDPISSAAQWGRSPDLPGHQPKSPRSGKKQKLHTPPNQKTRNEPKINLTTMATTTYKPTAATVAHPIPHSL